eukprot:65709-Prorocentrum_minimum.AAC.1
MQGARLRVSIASHLRKWKRNAYTFASYICAGFRVFGAQGFAARAPNVIGFKVSYGLIVRHDTILH